MRGLLPWVLGLIFGSVPATLVSQVPSVAEEELVRRYAVIERLQFSPNVILAEDREKHTAPVREAIGGRTFRWHCEVLVQDGQAYRRRFALHAPTEALATVTRAVGKALGLLWTVADSRLGKHNARLRRYTLDVWLCADAGRTGAEQTQRDLYVYDAAGDRSGLEWLRTLAHELGHFVLPGPVGYRAPESWSNGVLGERLFLSWLRDDLAAGKLRPDQLPFGAESDLKEYCLRQTDALLERYLTRGPDRVLLNGNDKKAMDEATALLIYIAYVHEPAALHDLLVQLPVRSVRAPAGGDFLAAYELWLSTDDAVSYRILRPEGQYVYLPAGAWEIRVDNGRPHSLVIGDGRPAVRADGSARIEVRAGSWVKLGLLTDSTASTRIALRRFRP